MYFKCIDPVPREPNNKRMKRILLLSLTLFLFYKRDFPRPSKTGMIPKIDINLSPTFNSTLNPEKNSYINPKYNWNINPVHNNDVNPGIQQHH